MSNEVELINALRVDNEALRSRQAELEGELRRRDRVIQGLIDNMPGMVYVTDAMWTLRHINRRASGMIGVAPEVMVGRPDSDFFPKELVEKWHENDRRMIADGKLSVVVEESAPHAGEIHVHRSIKFPIRDDGGEIFALGGISLDITEQRRAEERLRDSEANAQSMINASTDALLLVDATGAVVAANEAAAAQNGRSIEALIGARDPFPIDDPARRTALFEEVARTGRPLLFEEEREGSVFDLALYPIVDDGGALKRISVFCRDVTERRRIESVGRTNEDLLQSVLAHAPILIHATDREGKLTFSGGQGLLELGLTPHAIVGRSVFDVHAGAPAMLDHLHGALAGGTVNVIETIGDRSFEAWYLPIVDRAGAVTGMIAVGLDVSERLRTEEEHKRLQTRIIDAQRAAIRELGTPIIPLTADTVVVPIVGSMDSIRAQQLMEALLSGVAKRGAGTVIVDVTGADVLDAQVAEALLRAARAVKLLGARVILTGISPATAQALVTLDVRLDEILTLGSLQDGIAHALRPRER